MAEFVDIPVVPYENPDQGPVNTRDVANPLVGVWWTAETASGVPENVMGWLVAQGWEITGVSQDATTVPPTSYYALAKPVLSSESVLVDLCNSYTKAANDAKWANEIRYKEVREDWTELIESTQTQFIEQANRHNADLGAYITDLEAFMDDIDTSIEDNLDTLQLELSDHTDRARAFLVGLGATELARINEEYTAKLSVQLQDLIDRGLYTSVVALDITTRNHRDRDEQIQALNDRLMREKLANEHQLYGQQENMADHRHRAVVEKMNTATAQLDGWKSVAADNRQLMAYQLDERNKLIIGLYSFVERRSDIAPEWKDMASMIAGLGDAAGGWIQP